MGSLVKVVKVCFAYVVKPFTGEVVKVCSGPNVGRSIVVGVTGFKLTISMCSLIR